MIIPKRRKSSLADLEILLTEKNGKFEHKFNINKTEKPIDVETVHIVSSVKSEDISEIIINSGEETNQSETTTQQQPEITMPNNDNTTTNVPPTDTKSSTPPTPAKVGVGIDWTNVGKTTGVFVLGVAAGAAGKWVFNKFMG